MALARLARTGDPTPGGAALELLLVASCPPPAAGQSIATAMLLRRLASDGILHRVVNLSRPFYSGSSFMARAARVLQVARLPMETTSAAKACGTPTPVFYLQLGQTVRALARDLPLLLLARRRRWPTVVHVHGGGFRDAFDRCAAPMRRLLRLALRDVSRAVVLTPRLRDMFLGIMPGDRVRVVPNGVETYVEDDARTWRRAPGAHPFSVAFLSNLIESKGYVTVLEAARLAKRAGEDHEFVLAGAVTEHTSVPPRSFALQHGLTALRYVGAVDGPGKLSVLRGADVFALPTEYPIEGQPIAILEAMHYGLPIITCAQGGIPDLIGDERNGLVVPPRDPAALLAAVTRLRADPQLRAQIAARNRAEASSFTEMAHTSALLDVLREAHSEESAP